MDFDAYPVLPASAKWPLAAAGSESQQGGPVTRDRENRFVSGTTSIKQLSTARHRAGCSRGIVENR